MPGEVRTLRPAGAPGDQQQNTTVHAGIKSFEESQTHPSTHSFHKYLLNADHVAGTVPGTVDIVA